MATKRGFWEGFCPPALPEQEKLDAVVEKLRAMTPEQVVELSVRSGIHNPDGTLTEHYRK